MYSIGCLPLGEHICDYRHQILIFNHILSSTPSTYITSSSTSTYRVFSTIGADDTKVLICAKNASGSPMRVKSLADLEDNSFLFLGIIYNIPSRRIHLE